MAAVKQEESSKLMKYLASKTKENFIIKQIESSEKENVDALKKNHSFYVEEMDEEMDDFLAKRA